MNRKQIIESSRRAREMSQQPGFAQTPINPRHVARLRKLQGAYHNMTMKPGVMIAGSLMGPDEYARISPVSSSAHKDVKGEDGCMRGRGGKCVLCGTGDCLRRPE